MTTLDRFEQMKKVDMGFSINPLVYAFVEFFKRAEKSNQFDVKELSCILPTLRGYAINNPDELSVIESLDLCYVNINSMWFVENFERFLMLKDNWLCRYQYALEELNKVTA